MDLLEILNGQPHIKQTVWKKQYDTVMAVARDYFKAHHDELLAEYNKVLFKEMWEKYAGGTIASWEMTALGFYHTEHELKDVDMFKYGISDFYSLNEEPVVDYFFKRKGKEIPVFKTNTIIGTVIAKSDLKSTVAILTPTGVVNVKFTKDYFARYNRQISEPQGDGTKKVMEKGWFTRGTMVMVTGIRRGDQFQAKTYARTATHQLYKITEIDGSQIKLTHKRYGELDDED